VAATRFEPVAAFVRSRSFSDDQDIIPVVLLASACLDSRNAVELVESLPPARTLGIDQPTNWARITVAEILVMLSWRRWIRMWRFPSGCGIARFEE
jgi:hypothetical protein